MAASAHLMFPMKLKNVVLGPYGAFLYPLNVSDAFSEFPMFFFGGGLQIGIKGGKSGMLFLDVNYMTSMEDVYMFNPYGPLLAPNPLEIHYKRFSIGLGLGYKFGFGDRKVK